MMERDRETYNLQGKREGQGRGGTRVKVIVYFWGNNISNQRIGTINTYNTL